MVVIFRKALWVRWVGREGAELLTTQPHRKPKLTREPGGTED